MKRRSSWLIEAVLVAALFALVGGAALAQPGVEVSDMVRISQAPQGPYGAIEADRAKAALTVESYDEVAVRTLIETSGTISRADRENLLVRIDEMGNTAGDVAGFVADVKAAIGATG